MIEELEVFERMDKAVLIPVKDKCRRMRTRRTRQAIDQGRVGCASLSFFLFSFFSSFAQDVITPPPTDYGYVWGVERNKAEAFCQWSSCRGLESFSSASVISRIQSALIASKVSIEMSSEDKSFRQVSDLLGAISCQPPPEIIQYLFITFSLFADIYSNLESYNVLHSCIGYSQLNSDEKQFSASKECHQFSDLYH